MSWMTWDIIRASVNMIPTNMEVPHTVWLVAVQVQYIETKLPISVIWYLVDVGSKWTKPSYHHTQPALKPLLLSLSLLH